MITVMVALDDPEERTNACKVRSVTNDSTADVETPPITYEETREKVQEEGQAREIEVGERDLEGGGDFKVVVSRSQELSRARRREGKLERTSENERQGQAAEPAEEQGLKPAEEREQKEQDQEHEKVGQLQEETPCLAKVIQPFSCAALNTIPGGIWCTSDWGERVHTLCLCRFILIERCIGSTLGYMHAKISSLFQDSLVFSVFSISISHFVSIYIYPCLCIWGQKYRADYL